MKNLLQNQEQYYMVHLGLKFEVYGDNKALP